MSNIVKGSLVKFLEYQNNSKWEEDFGLEVGDTVEVAEINGESLWVLSKTGKYVCVHISQVVKCSEEAEAQQVADNVNSPNHYASQSIECIVAMEAMLSPEEFIGYLRGNIFKYQWRYKQKNGIEDLKKAQWYQNKLLEKEST